MESVAHSNSVQTLNSLYTNDTDKGMNPILFSLSIGETIEKTKHFNLGRETSPGEEDF